MQWERRQVWMSRLTGRAINGCMVILVSLLLSVPATAADIIFGYSPDGSPVSYDNRGMQGYCGTVYTLLKQWGYEPRPVPLAVHQRFAVFAASLEGKPGIQCGPSSRTPARVAQLVSAEPPYHGAFSRTFAITSTKLLVRNERLDVLETDPHKIRIGILNPDNHPEVVTSSLVRQVYPTAIIVDLQSREDALERLQRDASQPAAIDAYASDEIILYDMLTSNIPVGNRQRYSIFPAMNGFSREEYVLVAYNAPELLPKLDAWIASDAGQEAAARLQPPAASFSRVLIWLNRADHLGRVRLGLSGLALLAAAGVMWMWWWRTRRKSGQPLPVKTSAGSDPSTVTVVPASESKKLTEQEIRVALLKVQGFTAKEIARELARVTGEELSHRTVETHIQNIYRKAETRTVPGLLEFLRQQGLL